MDLIALLRASYLTVTVLILVVHAIPALRGRFLDYGARSSRPRAPVGDHVPTSNLLDALATLCVPHSWFASFYATSIVCSLFYAGEIISKGYTFLFIAGETATRSSSMTVDQVILVWALMLFQGSRRLYESLSVTTPSRSKMWVGHWVVGVLFYFATTLAIWIEGVPILREHVFTIFDFTIRAPGLRTFIGVPIFLLASGLQNDCHVYLASLKAERAPVPSGRSSDLSYQFPVHPAFNLSLTPHYFAECLIYFALAILAAPPGYLLNITMTCALIFVIVNLGITANGTRNWYATRFGPDTVRGRARMIPFCY